MHKISHVLTWLEQLYIHHTESKMKNTHNVRGKNMPFKLWLGWCQSKLFLMKKLQQSKRNKTNEYWLETLLTCDGRYDFLINLSKMIWSVDCLKVWVIWQSPYYTLVVFLLNNAEWIWVNTKKVLLDGITLMTL